MWSYDLSSSSNHTQASRSKWFVGSSSNNMKGLIKRALSKNKRCWFLVFDQQYYWLKTHFKADQIKGLLLEHWATLDDQVGNTCNLYLARATRILHPPLKSFSFFCCIALLKPKPWRIREARTSALSASSSSKRSYSSISFSHSAMKRKRKCFKYKTFFRRW